MKVKVNDVVLNYDVSGTGYPIILLHGNGENYTIFNKLIEKLQEDYTVYAVDSRSHGDSEDTEEVSYDLMAEDIIQFIKELNIENPMLYGFSDGGIVGLLIAIKEPELLSKLIVSGVNINPKGLKNGTYLGCKIAPTGEVVQGYSKHLGNIEQKGKAGLSGTTLNMTDGFNGNIDLFRQLFCAHFFRLSC